MATPCGTINTASCQMLRIDSEPASILWPSGCPSARCGIILRTPARTYAMYAESQASALRWAQLLAMPAKLCPTCGMSCFDNRTERPAHVSLAQSFHSNEDISIEKCICLDNKWFFHTTCFSCNIKECSSRPHIERPNDMCNNGADNDGNEGQNQQKNRNRLDSEDSFRVEENWFYYSSFDSHAAGASSGMAARGRGRRKCID